MSDLKDVIHKLLRNRFGLQRIVPADLQLKKVDLPNNDSLKDAAKDNEIGDSLIPTRKLSDVFPADLNGAKIHVIMRIQIAGMPLSHASLYTVQLTKILNF